MNVNDKTGRIARLGLLLSLALILSYVETFFPVIIGVPGVKLGLANLAVLLCLILSGTADALVLDIFRIVLAGFLFGNLYSIIYSLAGGLLSFAVMVVCRKTDRFSMKGISMAGGVFHNIGQLVVAAFVVNTAALLYYLPVLLIAGMITGLIIGAVCEQTVPRLHRIWRT